MKLTAEQKAYLAGPLVAHPGGWSDTLPGWLRVRIAVTKLLVLSTDLATEEEALAYLSTASLVGPLDGEWAAVMVALTSRVMAAAGKDAPGVDPRLDEHHERLLTDLRRQIRRSVVKHAELLRKEARRCATA